jgi:hypothetical protein
VVLDLLERHVPVAGWLQRASDVRNDPGPLLRRDVLHRVDRHRPVELGAEGQLLQADMLEPLCDAAGAGLGEHPGRLVGADDALAARHHLLEIRPRPAWCVEHDAAGRARREQLVDEHLVDLNRVGIEVVGGASRS